MCQITFSQITLENTYSSVKSYTFRSAKIDATTVVYYYLDDTTDTVKIFDANHNPLTTLTIPSSVRNSRDYIRMGHLTKYLFDSDEEYEYSVSFFNGSGGTYFYSCYVLNEDGTVLLDGTNFDINASVGFGSVETQGIVKTAAGDLKLVLSNLNSNTGINKAKVYSLAGVTHNLSKAEELGLEKIGVMPNPTVNKVNTVYHNNLVNGKVIVYNNLGQLMKQISVKSGTLSTKVDLSQFSTGAYYYQLYDGGNKIGTKKVINN